mmetsp:Transcript_46493/g.106621  ORF Transcript_46493/g.106621 Transcript_46493/m.106621 type:complete len:241 (-) Transcript_46493:40-762(-)
MVIAPVPFRGSHLARARSSTEGMRKASVFPDPVFACASTSSPRSSGGIASAWISVSVVKPISLIACCVSSRRWRATNGWSRNDSTGSGSAAAAAASAERTAASAALRSRSSRSKCASGSPTSTGSEGALKGVGSPSAETARTRNSKRLPTSRLRFFTVTPRSRLLASLPSHPSLGCCPAEYARHCSSYLAAVGTGSKKRWTTFSSTGNASGGGGAVATGTKDSLKSDVFPLEPTARTRTQ